MDRRRAAGALLALAACIASSAAAPTAGNHSALDLYDGVVVEGCYYNFQHYSEGDRIMTNEPCLNCTCHNRMLMCYLRVCPFTKPIGQNCTVEKRADQCCPIVTCPDVPVDLLTSTSTSSPAEYGATGLGKHDKYGCSIDGKYLPEGAKVPPTPNKPCEHCYCIRNMTTCVMQECTLHVDGCTPIYHKDVCCPVRYSCDHPEDEIPLLDDMTTTVRPTPGFILTTTTMSPVTQITQDCVHDDQVFADGALIKTEKACEHCYCMKGDIVCVVQECGTPMENEGKNCTSLPPREGQCCPDTYICEGDEPITEYANEFTTNLVDELTTLAPPKKAGVEGSGHRKEPDEIPLTDAVPIIPEVDGSGDEKITVAPQITVETPIPSTQSSLDMVTEQKIVTTESDKIYAEDKKDATDKPQKERQQADITDFDKSTTVSITEKTEYISPDTIVPFIEEKVTYSTEPTLVEKDTEDIATESYKQPLTVSEVSASEIPEQTTTVPDTKEKEDLPTTSSAIYDGGEKVSEENIIESSTSDDKIGLEFETTPATSHTLTLEEVEKEESELDKHKIETETSTEEFITESNEFVSSSEPSIGQQEEEPNKTAEGGLDKEITETHEFIPVTTGLPVLDVKQTTTTIDDEDIITEKEPDDEKYETTQRITSVSNVDEVLTQNKDKIEGEKYTVSEILPSTISISGTKQTESSTLNLNDFTDKATESPEYVTSKEHTSLVSSTDTEKSISPNIEQLTTITPKPYVENEPTLEEKEKIPTAEMDNKLITTTLHSETGNYVDDVTTTATAIDLGLKTTSAVFDKDITVEDSKYITSSEMSVPESESYYTTTEPDRSLNTIPAESTDKDNIPSVTHVSGSEFSFTKDDGTSMTTESGSNDLENNKQDRTSTELYNEIELVTSSHELQFETNKSSEEKDIKNITPVLAENGQSGTERTTQMKDGDSTTIVAQTEFDKGVTTETAIDKTNIPDIINQGENEIHEDTFIPSRIPGEGDCLQNGITYRNQSNVPSTNNCHTGCKCISSIIKCDPIICSPPPDYMDNCQPTYDPPDACCPTYECTHSSKETIPPQSQNQMSGTEAPIQHPSIECHGDQCEISEDKIEPTISHETCIGDKCKVDLDKKVEPSECGPQGCDKKDEQISIPQVSVLPDESCVNGKCHATKVELAKPCEGNKCIHSTDIPSLSCEGEKCTDHTKPTLESQQGISCNQENGCSEGTEHGISECEGESCRNKESTIVEKKPSTLCNNGDSSCLENNDRVSEHETDITTSSPINDITKADEHITHKMGIDKEMPEDTATRVPVDIEIPETQEIQTQKPETTEAELDITKQDSSTFKGDTATDVAVTEKIEDILSVTQSAREEEYTTEMKIIVPDDAQNELETLEYEKESDKEENTQASTAIGKETTVQSDIKPLHMDSDKTTTTSYDDREPGRVTKDDEEGSGYMDTEPHDITTELSMIEEKSTSSPDVHATESSSAQQFTDEISYTTEKQQSIDNATVPQYLPESHEPETTEILKPVTESELNIDLPLTTITSTLVERVTQPEDEQSKTGDKDENLNQKTTQYDTITSKKPTDTVISIATTPEYVQTVYEEATSKSEIDSTIADKVDYHDHDKEKIEPSTTSDIDTEEYITEKPEEGGIYGEKQTTLGDGLDSLSEVTERSEGVSEEQLQEQEPEINTDVTDIEVVKESFTTESTKTPKSDEPTKETIHETDNVHQQHVSETPEHEYYDKTTTEASISPSIEKEHEPDQPAITAQEELSTEDSLVSVTDKIYTNDNEKEIENLGKPVKESISTDEPLVFISTTDTIVEKVPHDIHVTSAETEASEHMIPVTTDTLQSVTKGMELEENDEFTTIVDNKLYTKQDITTQSSKTEFVSHTDSPINEYTQTPADKSELVTETHLTITSIIEGSESVTNGPQEIVTEVPQKETILPGAESYATTELYSTKGTDTQTSLGLELESKPTTNTEDTDMQKITVIPVTSQYDTQPHHEEKETTESGLLESTVTEAKDDKIPSKPDTILQEDVTESSKVTEKVEEHKMETTSKIEEDISSISNEIPATVEDEKISDLLESIRTEQPSVTIIDYSTTSDIILPGSDNNKDKTTQSASIYDIGHKEAQTLSPTTAIVEIGTTPLEEEITEHKIVSTESPEGIHDDKKETSPIYYTKQTTESNIKFSEDTSKISYDDTTPLQALEFSSTPSYEHSENQPDLVELEEHTHKIPEEYSTTTLTISDKASSSTERTENHEDEMATSLSPDKEKDISDNTVTEKIIEESGSMRPDTGEDKISDFETTEKIEPVQTIKPNLEKQTSHTESTDTALEETRTTLLPSSKDQIIVATEKVSEETVTAHNPKEKISPTNLIDETLEEALSTTPSSLERDTGITKVTENIPEKTTISPHLTSKDELINPSSTVNILEALTTTEPTLQKETSTTSPTDNVLEEKLTTPLITSTEESDDKDSIGHPKPEKDTGDAVISDKISGEIGTTSPPVSEEGAGELETTDKGIKDSATTMQPSTEKETSNAGQIDEAVEESITTLLPSYQEEASKADSTDILLETTTRRLEKEPGHEISTNKVIEEFKTTLPPSSDEKITDSMATDDGLKEAITPYPSSFEKEISHSEESDMYKVTEETPTTYNIMPVEETSHTTTADKILEETGTTTLSSVQEINDIKNTENILEESSTTLRPVSEEVTIHDDTENNSDTPMPSQQSDSDNVVISHTDIILEDNKTTPHPSFEEITGSPKETDKISEETMTTQRFSHEEDVSHSVTTDKIIEENLTTKHYMPEDTTTIAPEVSATTARTSMEEKTTYAEITEKVMEDIATTPRIPSDDQNSQEESQKGEPVLESTSERVTDERTDTETDKSTEIKEESATPVKESTETYLPTTSSAPELTSQSILAESSTLSVPQVTEVKHTTESQEKEMTSVATVSEKVPSSSIKPLEPEGEVVPTTTTTKATTISIDEYVTTHAPASVDKYAKPEEHATETSQSPLAPELPKPSGIQPTDEVPTPEEESHFPPSGTSGYGGEPDYGDEDQAFGPGTCRYGGKVYVSAQQIPRDDPCDFCFCFRSDIICLQQSCPPPIHGCHEEPIQGFCCPRYECPVSMATTLNVTTTTTTTTTTLPPHFPTHSYKGAAQRRGCQIKGHTYKVGEVVRASSGPCLHCTCGGDGQMKCDPKACTPEPMLRQMIAAAVSAKRRR